MLGPSQKGLRIRLPNILIRLNYFSQFLLYFISEPQIPSRPHNLCNRCGGSFQRLAGEARKKEKYAIGSYLAKTARDMFLGKFWRPSSRVSQDCLKSREAGWVLTLRGRKYSEQNSLGFASGSRRHILREGFRNYFNSHTRIEWPITATGLYWSSHW